MPQAFPLLALIGVGDARTPLPQGPDLTRYLIVCGGMIALILILAWGFRRLMSGTATSRAATRSLRVVDMLPLPGKQKLAVVRCYDRTFVLGLGEKEIALIAELDAQGAAVRAEPQTASVGRVDFASWLARLRGRPVGAAKGGADEGMLA